MINRMIIYTKDIQSITGKSNRGARRMMAALKLILGKEQNQFVTVLEFCQIMGLDEQEVRSMMVP